MSQVNYDRRAVGSWAFYDFANSAFTTLIVTFVYSTYFTQSIASDPIHGTALWSRGVTLSALVVALTSPVLGALADRGGYRKALLFLSTAVCVGATAVLYTVLPGQVVAALSWFIVANIAYETANVFYNAFLPDIAPADKIGRISGFGWGLGYVGGLVALVLALVGLVQPEVPWFGFSKEGGENIRATCLLVAVWYAALCLPIFLWVKEDKSRVSRAGRVLGDSFRQLANTCREIRKYRQIVRFLLARLVYNDGLITVFSFGGIYAAETFGFTMSEVMVFGIVLNVSAGLGAFAFGYLDDKFGGKRTIRVTLVGLTFATTLGVFAPDKVWFWVAGVAVGIFVGPNQSASRSLMARFVPPEAENEFFGFFAFSGKLTAFAGPMLLGILTEGFGSQRAGMAGVLLMFVVGLGLLALVDEREGIRVAGRSD